MSLVNQAIHKVQAFYEKTLERGMDLPVFAAIIAHKDIRGETHMEPVSNLLVIDPYKKSAEAVANVLRHYIDQLGALALVVGAEVWGRPLTPGMPNLLPIDQDPTRSAVVMVHVETGNEQYDLFAEILEEDGVAQRQLDMPWKRYRTSFGDYTDLLAKDPEEYH